MIRIGIDESGRGCLLGPMIVVCLEIKEGYMLKTKVCDSKRLSSQVCKKVRSGKSTSQIYEKYKSLKHEYLQNKDDVDIHIYEITAESIDNNNINDLELTCIADFISLMKDKYPIDKFPDQTFNVYIDKFSNKLDNICDDTRFNIIAEYKADSKYDIVSAASIIAKYNRDKIILSLYKTLGINFGSGYPSDPDTIKYIKNFSNSTELYYLRTKWRLKCYN